MEVYFDMEGTNAEVVDTVRDFEMRNLVEFGDMNLCLENHRLEVLILKWVENINYSQRSVMFSKVSVDTVIRYTWGYSLHLHDAGFTWRIVTNVITVSVAEMTWCICQRRC